VFVSVAGGAEAKEPGADLAIALAVAGNLLERPFPVDAVAVGEVGLGGEVRPVGQMDARLAEAERLGFKRALVPSKGKWRSSLATIPVETLADALSWLRNQV